MNRILLITRNLPPLVNVTGWLMARLAPHSRLLAFGHSTVASKLE